MSEDIKLHYEIHGEGDPVLFLHGLGANNYVWRNVVRVISGKKLILLDLKGFGDSPKPFDGKYSVHDQVDLLYQFIEAHNLNNLVLVGHSFGGGVALIAALKLPSKLNVLKGLILIDSPGYKQKMPFFIGVLKIPILGFIASLLPAKLQVKKGLQEQCFDPSKITEETINTYAKYLNLPGVRYAIRETAKFLPPDDIESLEKQYSSIHVPTLLIWGREDRVVPLEFGLRLNKDIKVSELVVIGQCGHVPLEEWPEKIGEEINKFLNSI